MVCWGKTGADGPYPPADVFCWPEDDRCWMPAETVERPSEPSTCFAICFIFGGWGGEGLSCSGENEIFLEVFRVF